MKARILQMWQQTKEINTYIEVTFIKFFPRGRSMHPRSFHPRIRRGSKFVISEVFV